MSRRSSHWPRRIIHSGIALVLVAVGLVAFSTNAFANAANPDPTTTGTLTVNGDGSVTANLSGSWTWVGQTCAGRYGTGWAVDWWGISTSNPPTPTFTLTNASVVNPPGITSTGSVSPTGAIPLPGGNFFHVSDFYAGETVNSAGTCTDTAGNSSGSWSATATYPSIADVPPNICVNMYDEHGMEGTISPDPKDFSASTNNDNSIQTNAFDPTAGVGFCVVPAIVASPTVTTTQASASTVAVGGTVTDAVTVTGVAAAGLPTGSVAFFVCGPTGGPALCTSTATPVGTAALPSAGDVGFVSTGTSGSFSPTAAGTWCFAAVFTPAVGSAYSGSSDNQSGVVDANECFTASVAPPPPPPPPPPVSNPTTTKTSASTSAVILGPGGTEVDTVSVTGVPGGGLPTGTVTFYLCGPLTAPALCTSTATPVGTATVPSAGDTGIVSTGHSNTVTPTAPGIYCFAAVFTPAAGSTYTGSSDNQSGTLDASECFTATPATTVTTTMASVTTVILGPGGTVADSVAVTGVATLGLPTGTVAFFVCGPLAAPALCTSTATPLGTVTLPSPGDTGIVSTGISLPFTPTAVGTYCFAAVFTPAPGSVYSGSSDNLSGTIDTLECFTADPVAVPIPPAPTAPIIPTAQPAQLAAAPVFIPATTPVPFTTPTLAFTGAWISTAVETALAMIVFGALLTQATRRRWFRRFRARTW